MALAGALSALTLPSPAPLRAEPLQPAELPPQAPPRQPAASAAEPAGIAPPSAGVNPLNVANNPLTDVSAVQVQTYYQPLLRDGAGTQANLPFIRAIFPYTALGRRNLMRISMPTASTAWNVQTSVAGFGDLAIFSIPLFDLGDTRIGIGPLVVVPTATSPELGLGKWQLGGQAVISKPYPWGLLAALAGYQQSLDGSSKDLVIQPFVFRHIGNGYYLRSSGIASINLARRTAAVPIGLGIGRVTRLADGNLLNIYLEPQISAIASGALQPLVQVFAGFNLQFLPRR